MKALLHQDVNRISSKFALEPKYYLGQYTRAYAACICSIALIEKQGFATLDSIDNLSYYTFGFAISVRKGKPMKTKGGLSLYKRIKRYLNGDAKNAPFNEPLALNVVVDQDTMSVFPRGEFERALEARALDRKRKALLFKQREKKVIRKNSRTGRQKILIKSDLKKITRMTALHLHQG